MLSYDIAGYFATWPQRLHALFQHVKTYREQNRQYVIQPNATHRQIELHTALNSTYGRIHTTFKPRAPFLSALVYHGFQRVKNMSDIFQIMSDIF